MKKKGRIVIIEKFREMRVDSGEEIETVWCKKKWNKRKHLFKKDSSDEQYSELCLEKNRRDRVRKREMKQGEK